MSDIEKLNNAEKIFKKISESLDYESIYHNQAYHAYDLYSNIHSMLSLAGRRVLSHSKDNWDSFLHSHLRSNVYYANVETLKGLILPQIPGISLTLNQSKKTENNKENKAFYDVCANILSVIVKNAIDGIKTNVWESFKLDYIITGRGVLWSNCSSDKVGGDHRISIENVRWQDFAMDTKPRWNSVDWVARRLLYTKRQFIEVFGVSEDDINSTITLDSVYADIALFDSFADNSGYIEVWEYWDKPTKTQYYVSKQYKVDTENEKERYVVKKEVIETADDAYFFPTTCPPLLMPNGLNLIPFSDVWNYIEELNELNQITKKRSNLIKTLHLKGYTDTIRATVVNALANSISPEFERDDESVVSVPGFTPNPQDPLIYYVDNMPRLQLLDYLQKEYDFLIARIYSLTGISEQMRNVTSTEDDETATSVRLKSKFGSRRLKEHQQRLLDYWTSILKILVHRVAQYYTKEDFKNIFTYDFRDSAQEDIQNVIFEKQDITKQLQQIQEQIQELGTHRISLSGQPSVFENNAESYTEGVQNPQYQGLPVAPVQQPDMQQPDMQQQPEQYPPQDIAAMQQQQQQQQLQQLQQQNEQLLQQNMKLDEQYEALINEITWDRIEKFFKQDKLVSFLITATLDDLENKLINDDKKNSDMEYLNTIINLVNQIIQNVNNNPQFVDIYTSMFSLCIDNFDQTKAQRDSIDNFITDLKKFAKDKVDNPPQQQPSPEDQKNMAAAQELQSKAQLLQAQIQEIQFKIQQDSQAAQAPEPQAPPDTSMQNKIQELQMKHQQDMELQQAKIQADQNRAQEKMISDEKLMQMKIEADKERYQEKIKSDYIKEGEKNEKDFSNGSNDGSFYD
jgi:hypothetical protein